MDTILRWCRRSLPVAMSAALGLGVWASSGDAGDPAPPPPGPKPWDLKHVRKKPTAGSGCGTLGYGPPRNFPGFQGFGLGYHLGYGYGGAALGPGAFGGYPFYGGPGYPHPWPCLNRFGYETPFAHDAGPGGSTPDRPNFYDPVGPLAPDNPVVWFEWDPQQFPDVGEFGCFTGSLRYPEVAFAPYTTIAGSAGSSSGVSNPTPPPNPSSNPPSNRSFGVDGEPVPDSGGGGTLGLKIQGILTGSVAEKAGLRVGDVLLVINGRLTQRSSDLFWILDNAATDKVLKIKVRSAAGGMIRDVTAQVP